MNEKTESLLSLHKCWLRASLMRDHFTKEANGVSMPINEQSRAYFRVYHHALFTYLDYWFSALFCTVEGYHKSQITIPEIDWVFACYPTLFPYLKNIRDSTYHFEIDRYKKINRYKGIEHLAPIELIHRSLGEYLSLTFKKISTLPLPNKPNRSLNDNSSNRSYMDLPSINNDGSDNFILMAGYSLMDYLKKASLFRDHFYNSLNESESINDYTFKPVVYFDYWAATLNIIIEGYKKLGEKCSKIDRFLTSPNLFYLRDYRNATFHYHKKYFNIHLIYKFIIQRDILEWLNTLHMEFHLYFLSKAEEFFMKEGNL